MSGPWADGLRRRLYVAYRHGFRRSFRSIEEARGRGTLVGLLSEAGVPSAPTLCEHLVCWAVCPWGAAIPSLHFISIDQFSSDEVGRSVIDDPDLAALARHGLIGTGRDRFGTVWSARTPVASIDAVDVRDDQVVITGSSKLHLATAAVISFWPPARRVRPQWLLNVLAAWREIAERYPDGPQPPASVEEARAIYGVEAGAPDAS